MPATEEISESLIRDNILHALTEVFGTMLHAPITPCEAEQAWPPAPKAAGDEPWVVGTVGFVGDINGLIYLYFDPVLATSCTGHMLGMTAPEVAEAGHEVVNDAIGELTNMVVGGFKNRLCDVGLPCKLTVPSILRGHDFRIEAAGHTRRHVVMVECAGRRIISDILMNAE
jgi:chemotaxis protein CheX